MSLKIAAEHLKSQGRGPDTELIHMTKGEIKGLRQLAQAHGGDLTVNPSTGLPEAGFLSTALPMVLGAAAAATGQEWAVPLAMAMSAGGEYAMTGSLTQGLMAGLGAWGGAGLTSGIMGLGDTALAGTGDIAGNAAIQESAGQMVGQNLSSVMPEGTQLSAETTGQITNIDQAGQALKSGMITPDQYSTLASQYSSAYAPAAAGNSFTAGLGSGNVMNYMGNHIGQTASVAAPLLGAALTQTPTLQGGPAATSNTTGYGQPLQRISPNFKGTFPTAPTQPYQAKYPNYVQNPYNPYATPAPTGMAAGGVADSNSPLEGMAVGGSTGMFPQSQITSPQYATPTQMPAGAQAVAADYDTKTNPMTGEMLPQGMAGGGAVAFKTGDLVNKYDPQSYMGANNPYDPQSYIKHAEAPTASAADMSVVQDTDPDTRNLDALSAALTRHAKINAAAKMPSSGIKSALPKAKTLGSDVASDSYMAQLAQLQKQQAAQQAPTQLPEVEAAQGGAIGMAAGGTTSQVYKPQYQNYQQTPFSPQAVQTPAQLQANTQAYMQQGVPTPTRGVGIPSTGYTLDPSTMIGSPVYKQQQDQLAAAQAQAQAAQDALNNYRLTQAAANSNEAGATGGLPKDFMHHSFAAGGMPSLGSYSDGGHLLKGPGDGMSDSIPAQIGAKQPARLADGEFVVPADVVSHLGNGSTEAGAKHLYAMMDKIRKARTGRKKQAPEVSATKYLPK